MGAAVKQKSRGIFWLAGCSGFTRAVKKERGANGGARPCARPRAAPAVPAARGARGGEDAPRK